MTAGRPDESARRLLAALLLDLEASAAGCWRVSGDRLEQVAFAAAPALPGEVARGFAEATRSVILARVDLGIVKAATTGAAAVSRASELPDSGSGYWLRAFGASRSVAVPLLGPEGTVQAVVAVALGEGPLDDAAVIERVLQAGRGWGSAG